MNDLEKAYADLEAAIGEVLRVKQFTQTDEGQEFRLTDWVVCAVQETMERDSDGDLQASFVYLVPGGQLQWHRILGTVRGCQMVMERNFANDGEDRT